MRRVSGATVALAKFLQKRGWKRSRRKEPGRRLPRVLYTRSTGETAPSLVEANIIEMRRTAIANSDVYP